MKFFGDLSSRAVSFPMVALTVVPALLRRGQNRDVTTRDSQALTVTLFSLSDKRFYVLEIVFMNCNVISQL